MTKLEQSRLFFNMYAKMLREKNKVITEVAIKSLDALEKRIRES